MSYKLFIDDVSTVYTRWGRSTCPGTVSEPVYNGFAGGSLNTQSGGAPSMLCLPRDPDWDAGRYNDAKRGSSNGIIYGAEYRDSPGINDNLFGKSHFGHDIPCVVCLVRQSSVLIITGKSKWGYDGWSLEYSGYLMSSHLGHQKPADFYCVDKDPEDVGGGAVQSGGLLLYFVEARCGSLRCPPYVDGREFQCAVCTINVLGGCHTGLKIA